MLREHTKEIKIGGVTIGGNHPIAIQSMTNTKTEDVEATVSQILASGARLDVRLSVVQCLQWKRRRRSKRSKSRSIFRWWQIFILIISWQLRRSRTAQTRSGSIREISAAEERVRAGRRKGKRISVYRSAWG